MIRKRDVGAIGERLNFSALILIFVLSLAVHGMAEISPDYKVSNQAGMIEGMQGANYTVGDVLTLIDTSAVSGESIVNRNWIVAGPTPIEPSSNANYTLPDLSLGNYQVELNLIGSSIGNTKVAGTFTIVEKRPELISANFTYIVNHNSVPASLSLIDQSQSSNGVINRWAWAVDSIPVSSVQSPSLPVSYGYHLIDFTVANNQGYKSSISRTIVVQPDSVPRPIIYATPNPANPKQDVQFYILSSDYIWEDSWYWDFGDGATSPLHTPTHAYSTPGRYTVNLKSSNVIGEGIADPIVVLVRNPVNITDVTASALSGVFPLSVAFTAAASVNNKSPDQSAPYIGGWTWDFGDTDELGSPIYSTEQNPTHVYTKPGNYYVSVFCTLFDGNISPMVYLGYPGSAIPIVVGPNPYADFYWDYLDQDPTCCYLVKFTDKSLVKSLVYSWDWEFGDGSTSTEQNPTHRFKEAGDYSVNLTINGGGDSALTKTYTVQIMKGYVTPTPTPTPSPTPTVAPDTVKADFTPVQTSGKEYSFIDQSTKAVKWSWIFGDGESSSEQSPNHVYPFTGRYYYVTLKVWDSENNLASVSKGVYT